MQIDETIEGHVREAYSAVVGRDGDRMVRAFEGLTEDARRNAIALGAFVCGFIINDAYPQGPTDADLLNTAKDIVEEESGWIDLGSAESVAAFLGAVARGDTSFPGVPKEDIVGHIFVCGGHLLATRREENQRWWEYLNEIWASAEAADHSS
jgi:hypothetical protein